MKKNVLAVLLCTLLTASATFAQYKVVTYLPTWKSYPANVNNFDVSKVTHICIAFANPDAAGNLIVTDNGQSGVATIVNAAHGTGEAISW